MRGNANVAIKRLLNILRNNRGIGRFLKTKTKYDQGTRKEMLRKSLQDTLLPGA